MTYRYGQELTYFTKLAELPILSFYLVYLVFTFNQYGYLRKKVFTQIYYTGLPFYPQG